MSNRTEGVKTLVEEVLATLPTPYSEDVIDEVFLAIEANPTWLTAYRVLGNDLGVTVVNQAVGSWTSKAVGRTGDRQVLARSKLTESYSKQYENGMTPEDMVRAYDTLGLADVHAVIAFYFRYRDQVRAYLKRRAEEAEALRAKIEADRPRVGREELLARCRGSGTDHVPTGQ